MSRKPASVCVFRKTDGTEYRDSISENALTFARLIPNADKVSENISSLIDCTCIVFEVVPIPILKVSVKKLSIIS